jgi:hypothetical protein
MVQLLRSIAAFVRWFRRSPAEREAEIVYLRQQLIILKRATPARPRLKTTDRLIFVCLYRLFPSLLDASIIFKPETPSTMAPKRLSPVLALEVAATGRPTRCLDRHPKPCSAHQSREPSVGCPTHSWRAAQARDPGRPVDRGQVHGPTARSTITGLEDLPTQSRPAHRRHRYVCRADHRLQAALWFGHHPP